MTQVQTATASANDRRWLRAAIELSRSCPTATSAYAVGAIIVGPDGRERSRGYSREWDPSDHAEQVALRRAEGDAVNLAGAVLYTSLEPCSLRRSHPRTCTELIIAAGIAKVVFAWREPDLFADCRGAELLAEAGVTVVEAPDLAADAQQVNAHLWASA